jgi:methionyl-tRNA formyltransferase
VIEFPQTPSILTLAAEHGLPVLELESFEDPAFLQRLTEMSPDLITVACFPRRFPRAVLDLPRHGCWNVHPSLLPRHRGPAPLFWAFRDGDTETGVTVHIMDDGIDSGDILLQQAIPIPEGIRGSELERTCAEVGARLLLDAVQRVSAGGSEGVSPLPRRRQQLDLATYESWPTIADLEIPLERSASWAFQFIRGIGDWYPVTITAAGHRLRVRDALGHCPKPDRATLPREIPYRQAGDEVWIRMNPGVLHVRVG